MVMSHDQNGGHAHIFSIVIAYLRVNEDTQILNDPHSNKTELMSYV